MRSVRLSHKIAKALVAMAKTSPSRIYFEREVAEAERALKPRPVSSYRVRKEKKRGTKRQETARIREAVMRRADGKCECGCGGDTMGLGPLELDHFWGRGKEPQTVENCWALSRWHHRLKTENKYPGREGWLRAFAAHCDRHGYAAEAAKARARLESLNLIDAAQKEGMKP